jgi:hypothetical protein
MRVLYLTEEHSTSFVQALTRAGLSTADHLGILRKSRVTQPWQAFAPQLPALCHAEQATLVLVDTIFRWWGLPPKAENDSGAIRETLEPLARLATQGVAVLLVHHLRKMGGDEGTQARGSGSLAAAVDIVLELRRYSKDTPNRRLLECYSRFDETPASLMIELTEAGYQVLGDQEAVELADLQARVWDVLPADPTTAMTRDDLAEAAHMNRGMITKTLDALEAGGHRVCAGAGKRGDPHKFSRNEGKPYKRHSPETETPCPRGAEGGSEPLPSDGTTLSPAASPCAHLHTQQDEGQQRRRHRLAEYIPADWRLAFPC